MQLQPLSALIEIDPVLSAAVVLFCVEHPSLFDHPGRTYGQCYTLAAALASHLVRNGIDAEVVDGCEDWEPRAEAMGMDSRLNVGCSTHYWTVVGHAGMIYAVDLSSTQYGYAEPMFTCAPIADRQRCYWVTPAQPLMRVSLDDIRNNRLLAGIPRAYLDPETFDVWIDPCGDLHILDGPQRASDRWYASDMRDSITELWTHVGQIAYDEVA